MPARAINLREKLAAFAGHWSPKVVAEINANQFRPVKSQGELVWHRHDDTDEAFLVPEGGMTVAFGDHEVHLRVGEPCVVPRGVEHLARAAAERHARVIEPRGWSTRATPAAR
jgi:mannose-6-phosphate isomerase-like protein (cupin superfamily)